MLKVITKMVSVSSVFSYKVAQWRPTKKTWQSRQCFETSSAFIFGLNQSLHGDEMDPAEMKTRDWKPSSMKQSN